MVDLVIIGGGLRALLLPQGMGKRSARHPHSGARQGAGRHSEPVHPQRFGLHRFGEQLTGPEYAGRFIEMLKDTGVKVQLDTMVLEVTPDKKVHCVSRSTATRSSKQEHRSGHGLP